MIKFFAITILVLAALNIVLGPFLIGKPREPYSALSYVLQAISCGVEIYLMFYILGTL